MPRFLNARLPKTPFTSPEVTLEPMAQLTSVAALDETASPVVGPVRAAIQDRWEANGDEPALLGRIGFEGSDQLFDVIEAIQDRLEEAKLAKDALAGLAGDPDKVEAVDLDASSDFTVGASEDGDVLLTRLGREVELDGVTFDETTDSYEELVAQALLPVSKEARMEARQENRAELAALAGDPEQLEAEDFDASLDYTIDDADGFVLITVPVGSRETNIPFSEDTDTFVELVEFVQDLI
ncbi:MAG: hypothetical protein ACFBSD_10255 [Paracoccaceae bacterium]